jgi:hypothetical protein
MRGAMANKKIVKVESWWRDASGRCCCGVVQVLKRRRGKK